jgi:acetyl-CoA acetyltransferase
LLEMYKRARLLGIGRTPYYRASNRSVLDLALEATTRACEDAGVPLDRVTGACTYGLGDTISAVSLLNALGTEVHWLTDLYGGASVSLTAIMMAASVVDAGLAEYVVVFRALNGRSGFRLGGSETRIEASADLQFSAPVGMTTYGQSDAMMARRHMALYGTTSAQFGAIAVAARKWALLNDWAVSKRPLSLDDHQTSRMIADPFRIYDFCLESDCGYAVIIGPEDGSATKGRNVKIASGIDGGGPRPGAADNGGNVEWLEHARTYGHFIKDRLYKRAGLSAAEMDIVCLYDCFTFTVLSQLEGFGFAAVGDGGPMAESGALAPGGSRPVNTHGGLLSEGYGHGFNHLYEAVSQLRNEAGIRQQESHSTALLTAGAMTTGCALILTTA